MAPGPMNHCRCPVNAFQFSETFWNAVRRTRLYFVRSADPFSFGESGCNGRPKLPDVDCPGPSSPTAASRQDHHQTGRGVQWLEPRRWRVSLPQTGTEPAFLADSIGLLPRIVQVAVLVG